MPMTPMNQFCCGCALTFGMKLILILNAVQCLFTLVTTTSNVLFRIPTMGFHTSLATQTFNAGWALAGLPFIIAGWFGTVHRLETNLRLYLYYSFVGFFLDTAFVMVSLGPGAADCSQLPSILASSGAAFACGAVRMFTIAFVLIILGTEVYFLYVTWSYCEDCKTGGDGLGLPDLIIHGKSAGKNAKKPGGTVQTSLFTVTNDAGKGFGGSNLIYGHHHDTNFPPKA